MVRHANFRESHGASKTPLWEVWNAMLQRCYNTRCRAFRWYGAKGVSVCTAWRTFSVFKAWAEATGYRDGLTIDRREAGGNYEPDNCRWITQEDNARRNATVLITAWGETKTAGQWVEDERCKVAKESALRMRIQRGMTPEEAISTPARKYGSN